MNTKKRWYDYLWIFSSVYLALGFLNILFAWIGLICFITPLLISIVGGGKGYCNTYCGRGQLFELLGGRLGLSRKKAPPKFLRSKWFRYGFLTFFMAMFCLMLYNTYRYLPGQRCGRLLLFCGCSSCPGSGRIPRLFRRESRSSRLGFTASC